jgi:membrane-bound ClpP family serine protease
LVLGSVFLFPTTAGPGSREAEAVPLSPWLIAGVTLASLGFFGVALSAVARAQRLRAKVSTADIVGGRGRAKTSLAPLGAVQIESELWTAIANGDAVIEAGDEVEVVAVDGLKLLVKRVGGREP